MTHFVTRANTLGKIDSGLHQQYITEISYWQDVLRRVVSVIKFLAKRGLLFRGKDEKIGSIRNGNFLGCIELISEYDIFLKTHLDNYANKGK